MKKNSNHWGRLCRLAAGTLAAAVFGGIVMPCAVWAEEAGHVISIRNPGDLVELSRDCALDTWSRGKRVVLEADIDLADTEFQPIPTFGGTFSGNGHTISNLFLADGISCQGLFRYIQEGGVVEELRVVGAVTAQGEETYLGALAGSNAGTILDCTFRGTVQGKKSVGGIAGINQASGSIYRCTAFGAISGEQYTGGITGQNLGTVTGCVNRAEVNTVTYTPISPLEGGISFSDQILQELSQAADETKEILDTTTDTGGIAGSSSGVLRGCRNEGTVGYPHVGYNVGGVVGRSSGYLDGCVNSGEVMGRKDVGGVAGQMAPNILLIFSESAVSQLGDALSDLERAVGQALDHAEANGDQVSKRLEDLSGYTRSASDSAADLANMTVDWVDGNLEEINDLSETVADVLDQLESITAGGQRILDEVADGMGDLEQSMDALAAALGMESGGVAALREAVRLLESSGRQAGEALRTIRQALRDLAGALVVEDEEAAAQAAERLRVGAAQLGAALSDGEAALRDLREAADREETRQALERLAESLHMASQAAKEIGGGIADGLGSLKFDEVQLAACLAKIKTAAEQLRQAGGTLVEAVGQLRKALDGAPGLAEGLTRLASAFDHFEEAGRDLGTVAGKIHRLFRDLSWREPVTFDQLGETYHQAGDALHSAVSGIGNQMDLLRGDISTAGDATIADLRNLEEKFSAVVKLLVDAVSDTQGNGLEDIWHDVSEGEIQSATLGKAKGCSNSGAIQGDLNVGGVAGAMAVEYEADPEDDIERVGTESLNFRYETRAILQNCVNQGTVTAKKSAAGGVAGRMDLGYLLDCENYGTIEIDGGEYVGGVVGISDSVIRRCWAKCGLSGSRYVGGIAGYGKEIYDSTALVWIEDAEGYVGAIAGDFDQEGKLSGNRFVPCGLLAGVDGVSYAGIAEPVAYEDLDFSQLPAPFQRLEVTYMVDGHVSQQTFFSYGDSLAGLTPPAVPAREGYFGAWEEIGEENITYDHLLEAVYTPYNTTLAGREMRSEVQAVLLVEGSFAQKAWLQLGATEQTGELERWDVALHGCDREVRTFRFAAPADWEDHVALRLITPEGSGQDVEWKRDGSYCVFATDLTSFRLEASYSQSFTGWLLLAGGVVLAGGAAALLIVLRRRKRRAAHQKPSAKV